MHFYVLKTVNVSSTWSGTLLRATTKLLISQNQNEFKKSVKMT